MKNITQWTGCLVGILFFLSGVNVSAGAEGSADDIRLAKVAKDRSYPGGREEEDLQVQNQLVKPTRKVGRNASNEDTLEEEEEF